MKTKEIPAAGYCVVKPELTGDAFSAGTVHAGGKKIDSCANKRPLPYRWLNEGFQIFLHRRWEDAQSTDFNFLDDEKAITKAHFKNYYFADAINEIKEWSAKDLKQFLKICGYKTWTKDIMVSMVQDLARIHLLKMKLEKPNHFLVKQK